MTDTKKHKSGLFYETTNRPFFGPKQRAIIELNKFKGTPKSESEFIDYLQENYKTDFSKIEWIRFHDFKDKSFDDRKFEHIMRLAIFNVSPSISARQIFFEEREDITVNTGWYPLVMGERANFRMSSIKRLSYKNPIESIGNLIGFKPISNSDKDGISFELEGSQGKYLFDFGYSGSNKGDYKAFFLTHSHSDHSNGFNNTLLNNSLDIPTLCSKPNASFLAYRRNFNPNTKSYQNIFHIDYKEQLELPDKTIINFIQTYHSPGSTGFQIKDSKGKSFIYLGDICLKNGFSDFRKSLIDYISKNKSSKNYLLLDGAMIGRKYFIEEEDTPESILDEFAKNVSRRNIIFFSNQPENSIYSYLKVYSITQQIDELKSIKLLVSPSLMQSLKFLIEPIVLHQDDFKDPVYSKIFGKSKSNPVESHRLYPLTTQILKEINDDERTIIFAGINDLKKIIGLEKKFERADIILAGTFALREDLPPEITKAKPRTIIRVASENWGFHSNEKDLKEFIEEIYGPDMKVFLFHNFHGRLAKFIDNNRLNKQYIKALGDKYFTERY
jgi:hypothetical protein